jgi:uncharacterized protein YtpQ (UPF0354 family)
MLNRLFKIFRPEPDLSRFAEEVAESLRNKIPGSVVEIVNRGELKLTKPNASPSSIYLDNLQTNCLQNWRNRKRIIDDFLNGLLELDPEALLPKNIIPTIKDKNWIQEVKAYVKPGDKPTDELFVSEIYNDELLIVYAVDSPKSIRYLQPKDLLEVNLHGETLRTFAIKNLQSVLPAIQMHGQSPCFSLSAGNMFEASLLLMDRVWDKKELGIEGEIVIAIPSRETLLVADTKFPESVEKMKATALEISKSAAYRLTDHCFVRRSGRFEPLVQH